MPSHPDTIMLGIAVEQRFLRLLEDHLRIKFEEIHPPVELDPDMLLWREMRLRHRKGDYRNTDDELKATRRIADWTLKVNCELKNQTYVPTEWRD